MVDNKIIADNTKPKTQAPPPQKKPQQILLEL